MGFFSRLFGKKLPRPQAQTIPAEFEADVQKLAKLEEDARRNPSVNRNRVA